MENKRRQKQEEEEERKKEKKSHSYYNYSFLRKLFGDHEIALHFIVLVACPSMLNVSFLLITSLAL